MYNPGPMFLHYRYLVLSVFKILATLWGIWWYLIVVSVYVSLMTNGVYFVFCLLVVHTSFYLHTVYSNAFSLKFFYFILWLTEVSPYYVTRLLSDRHFENISSHHGDERLISSPSCVFWWAVIFSDVQI